MKSRHPYDNICERGLCCKGEGVHHLAFQVDDLDGMLDEVAKEGIEPVLNGDSDWGALACLNIDKTGGVMLELLEARELT